MFDLGPYAGGVVASAPRVSFERPWRSRIVRRGAAVALVPLLLAAGCSRNGFDDRTARVAVHGRTTTYTVDTCGLDGTTVFVVGRAPGGSILQAVVGIVKGKNTGVPASTGITFSDEGVDLAAFGPESWSRRGEAGRAPGRVTSARLRGSRIQVSGEVEAVDGNDRPSEPRRTDPFSFDARCDLLE